MWRWFSVFNGRHSLQELHRFLRDREGQRRRSKAPCNAALDSSFEIGAKSGTSTTNHPAKRACFGSVDEKTYTPDSPLKMGDHPGCWSNEHVKARNVYIFMDIAPNIFRIIFHNTLPQCHLLAAINDRFLLLFSSARQPFSRLPWLSRNSLPSASWPSTRKGRTGPYSLCAASPALLRRTRPETQFLLRIHNTMGTMNAQKLKSIDLVLWIMTFL